MQIINFDTFEIAQKIKQYRRERGLTQGQFGELVGVQQAQISKIESGSLNVTMGTLQKVFNALDTQVKMSIY
jgi:transcriptional regulator with XRE-family HTH domain